MTTVKEVINGSLKKLGVFAPGESATATEISDAVSQLNRMLQSWSTHKNGIHAVTTESFNLANGQQDYTYGSGGDFDSARPVNVLNAWLRDNGVDFMVIETTYHNWSRIGDKDLPSYPKVFLLNPSYPKATLSFYPVPDDTYSIYFHAIKPLAQYASATDSLNLPPEYEEAIEWNLAFRLAPEYIGQIPQVVAMSASETFNHLKSLHSQPVPQINTNIQSGRTRAYNIYEDE